jgi:NAD(P)-dependent dehydrogenase (short-subunit alcohol dehydrogenase family)
MDKMLKDKAILITGSSTGIGRAIAQACIREGANVMIHGLDEAETKASAEKLGQPHISADLAKPESADLLIEATVKSFGKIDGLVNNAALITRADLTETDADFFDLIMAINVRSALLLVRAALPHFRKQGKGVVLNIGSLNAYCGEPRLLAYAMSKGAMMTMTRNLADAYSREHIRVNQLNLGWTLSENEIKVKIKDGQPEDWYKNVSKTFAPSGSLLTPEQIAPHAVHWLSNVSEPVSGAVCEIEQYPVIGRNPSKEE